MRGGLAVLLAGAACAGAAVAQPAAPDGRRVFQQCYACHSVDPRERNLPGPSLAGIVGRRAATEKGFDYSPALRRAAAGGLVWTEAALDRFLADPEAMIPRTGMSYVGLRTARERAAVIGYLKRGR